MAQRREVAGADPDAPLEFVACARCHVFPGHRLGLVDDAKPCGAHTQPNKKTLDDAVAWDLYKQGPSDREQRAVRADEHVRTALEKLEQRLVPPVQLLAVR